MDRQTAGRKDGSGVSTLSLYEIRPIILEDCIPESNYMNRLNALNSLVNKSGLPLGLTIIIILVMEDGRMGEIMSNR